MEMVRVNTRISSTLNEWLDKQTEETGIPKSTLVMLALEQYKQQREAMDSVGIMSKLVEKLEALEQSNLLEKKD